jgi:hypothetical protein
MSGHAAYPEWLSNHNNGGEMELATVQAEIGEEDPFAETRQLHTP